MTTRRGKSRSALTFPCKESVSAGSLVLPVKTLRLVSFAIVCLSLHCALVAADSAAPLNVGVTSDSIVFMLLKPHPAGALEIRELPLYTQANPATDAHTVWKANGAEAEDSWIPRFDGAHDRLFAKFQLVDSASGQTIGEPQYVTDFNALPVREHSLKRPAGKKGLGCVVQIADCATLGVKHAKEDISIEGLLDWRNPAPALSFDFEGRKVGLHRDAVARLDSRIKQMSDQRINVIGCLLNYVRKDAVPAGPGVDGSPLIHPLTNPKVTPNSLAAFNTATADGVFYYAAIVHWLVERYTRPDEAHGRMSSLIIGNELQSHWEWYNMGEAPAENVVREYLTAVHIAELAARSVHRDYHIYISMEHHWTLLADAKNARRSMSGADLLKRFADAAYREGDFPWLIAFHPYPENLFEPRFWNDKTAPLRLDAPRITFQNLEVLNATLQQPEYLYAGHPRLVALTEQGFHCSDKPDGADNQAAAYAYAFKRIEAMPGIELFIYHRHVDNRGEGGLNLGLLDGHGPENQGMGHRRPIWEVFEKAETPGEDEAFAFSLPIVGRTDWKNLVGEVTPAITAGK